MSTSKHVRKNRMATRVAAVAAVPCAAVAILAGAAGATGNDDLPTDDDQVVEVADEHVAIVWNPEAPVWVHAAARQRLCALAAELPSDSPAAQALRRIAEQPLGDAAQRARWRRDAEMMPSYWPAAQVLLADAEQRWDCSFVS
jgi:hypothetical protein